MSSLGSHIRAILDEQHDTSLKLPVYGHVKRRPPRVVVGIDERAVSFLVLGVTLEKNLKHVPPPVQDGPVQSRTALAVHTVQMRPVGEEDGYGLGVAALSGVYEGCLAVTITVVYVRAVPRQYLENTQVALLCGYVERPEPAFLGRFQFGLMPQLVIQPRRGRDGIYGQVRCIALAQPRGGPGVA